MNCRILSQTCRSGSFFCILILLFCLASPKSMFAQNNEPIVLNFDGADLYEVVRTFSDLLDINFIATENIQGKVNIHTAGTLKKSDLFPIFFTILEANGLTAVKEGSLYRIHRMKDAGRMGVPIEKGRMDASSGERIITQIIVLRHISGQELTKLITPFVSTEATVVTHEETSTLLLVDKESNIRKVLKLVDVFDVDLFEKYHHRFFPVSHVEAKDVKQSLEELFSMYGAKEAVRFIVVERLNTIIAVTTKKEMFETVSSLINQFDIPMEENAEPRLYVYSVKNGQAKELADLLNAVFTGKSLETQEKNTPTNKETQTGQKEKEAPVNTPFGTIHPKKKEPGEAKGEDKTDGSGTLKNEVTVTPDEIRNALIIEATPRDYHIIENLLNKIDILPRQVLIEAVVAEISLDTKTELGVEWEYVRGPGGTPETYLLSGNIGEAGMQYVIGQSQRWSAAIKALASQKKVNILSSPTILASDNKEARIDISTEIPVASAQYEHDSGNDPILQTNIQYRNTGVIFSVTPHINEFGLVSMDISQEVSEQSESVNVGNTQMSSFFKRSVETTLTVNNGQTIVIGGLIRQNVSDSNLGTPCLINIPIVKYLFGKESESVDKTELIILITPRVITTLDDVDIVTQEFKDKVGDVIQPHKPGSYMPGMKKKTQ